MKRRTFVAATAAASLRARAADGWLFFTAEEVAAVEALTDAIIPADDYPGAKQAKVARFLDKQLAGPLKRFARRYRDQLPKLDAAFQQEHGKRLAVADLKTLTAFLDRVDRGEIPGKAFFDLVIDHTMQGFYGSPRHGGNANAVSWKMLGIEEVMGHDHEA